MFSVGRYQFIESFADISTANDSTAFSSNGGLEGEEWELLIKYSLVVKPWKGGMEDLFLQHSGAPDFWGGYDLEWES